MASLHDVASWLLLGRDGGEAIAMAYITPFRGGGGTGHLIPGTLRLDLIYVLANWWGKGSGGMLLDAVIDAASRPGSHRIFLWTREYQNERAQRLSPCRLSRTVWLN